MATAAELLADVLDVDRTLVVDNSFRTIKIPPSVPNLGVEHDDDVLRLDFKMPRYIGNIDLMSFSVRINYINAKGESDVYIVPQRTANSQYITFSWLVGPTATRYKGNTQFNICAKTLKTNGKDDNGNTVYIVDKEFNTTPASLPVLAGLEVDESIVTEYSDIIEQWRRELFRNGNGDGSMVFNDHETNTAEGEFASAFGSETKALGKASIAAGLKKSKSGCTYAEDDPDFPQEDWRYNEAVGEASEAHGMGAIAYSRASKSLGYRTQTGYPPNAIYANKRPEAMSVSDYSLSVELKSMSGVTPDSIGSNLSDTIFRADDGGTIVLNVYGIPTRVTCEYLINPSGGATIFIEGYDPKSDSYILLTHDSVYGFINETGETIYVPIKLSFNNSGYTKIRIRFSMDNETNFLITNTELYGYPGDNVGQAAVAIGSDTAAVGNNSLAGGYMSVASGMLSTALGRSTKASGGASVALGEGSEASGERSFAAGIGTKAQNKAAVALGISTIASGQYSLAGGSNTKATSEAAVALGVRTTASNAYAFAMGADTEASGMNSLAIGAKDSSSGKKTRAAGFASVALGQGAQVTGGSAAVALGYTTTASNMAAMAVNYGATASHIGSFAAGCSTVTGLNYQAFFGKYNAASSTALLGVGNGTSAARNNAFVVNTNGTVQAQGQYGSMGADYAEFFEWLDGNHDYEDRIGLLVTLEGEKIRLAQAGDDVLGIISGTAAVLGDSAEMHWKHQYLTDEYGRTIFDMVEEFAEIVDEETGKVTKTSVGFFPHPRLNPEYDPEVTYIPREERPEWDKVGMMGKLYTRDDGTCTAGCYGCVGENGTLTKSETPTNIRVMKRTSDNIVLVLLK